MAGSARRITVEFLGNNRDLDAAMDGSQRKSSKFGAALGKAAKVGALGLAAGVAVAGKALYDMTKAAAEDEAAQVRLAQTLKNATGATSSQVAAVEDWISKQGLALGVTDDELRPAMEKLVVATGDVAEAQKLASLAMDISAGRGISLEAASKALARAQNGQVDGLSRLGIATKNAAGETLTFDQLTNKLGKTFEGQASKKANTFQGKMDRLKLAFNETKEEIGAKLLPVVTRLATWFLAEGLPAISRFGAYLQDVLPPIFEKVQAVVKRVMGALRGDTGGAMADIKSLIRDAVTIIQFIWRKFGKNILNLLRDVFNAMKNIVGGVFKIIRGIFKVFASVIKGDWKGAWDGIKLILRGAWQAIKGIVQAGLAVIKFAFRNAWTAIKTVARGAWDGLKDLARVGIDKLIEYVRGTPRRILNQVSMFKNAGEGLIQALLRGISGAAGFAAGFASDIWNAVRSVINSGIDSLNDKLEFSFKVKGVGISVNAPDIGHLARGTNNWRGGWAVTGEEGPELVNLPRGSQVIPHRESMGALRSAGGAAPIIINVNGALDPLGVARQIEKMLRDLARQTGRPIAIPVTGSV